MTFVTIHQVIIQKAQSKTKPDLLYLPKDILYNHIKCHKSSLGIPTNKSESHEVLDDLPRITELNGSLSNISNYCEHTKTYL